MPNLENCGTLLKEPILNFYSKKETIDDLDDEKNKDEITIIYNRSKSISDKIGMITDNLWYKGEKESIDKLFGEEFVENNKDICKMIINEKEYELSSFFQDDNDEIKEDIFEIKLKGISKIKNASSLFWGCISLISLPDISKWDTSNIINMGRMFSRCSSLSYLDDISNWDTSNVRYMNGMFFNCQSLSSLPDISKWNTSKVFSFSEIFSHCCSLKSLPDISKFDTSNSTNINRMFSYCCSLKSLPDISKWNTSNALI